MSLKNCVYINEVLLNSSDFTIRSDFKIVAGLLYAAMFAFGLLSNTFVIVAVIKYKNLLTNFQNFFIGNLAVGDLLICLLSVPITAYVDFFKEWPLSVAACRIIPFIQGVCILVSSFTLAAIAIDRYFQILRRERIDQRTTMTIVLLIWAVSCIICIPLAINNDVKPGKRAPTRKKY